MRFHARIVALLLVCGVSLSVATAASGAAELPVIERLVATNCTVKTCGQENVAGPFFEPKAKVTVEEAEKEGFTQAGGRVPFGVTDFKLLTVGSYPNKAPTSIVTHIRTDVAPGLATNPFAVPQCSQKEFGEEEAVPGTGFFPETSKGCEESEIGEQQATVYGGNTEKGGAGDLPLSGKVYDLSVKEGERLASLYGVSLALPKPLTEHVLKEIFKGTKPEVEKGQYYAHSLIKGNVEWGKQARGTGQGDYHDYFEIDVSPALPLVRSRLVFFGNIGKGDFVTNATNCPGHLTTRLVIIDAEKVPGEASFTTPIGLTGCGSLLFQPTFGIAQSTTQSDTPDEVTTEATEPHNPKLTDQSQVKAASITLPEGMTLNPAAAAGLEACTPAQARIHGEEFGTSCPVGSRLGTVALDVPTLPNGSLTGYAYLGGPESEPITGPPYTVYIVANSVRYGVSVRLAASVTPDPVTGRLTTVINEPPEQPFSRLTIQFERGVLAPLANPLVCGAPGGSATFTPYAPGVASKEVTFGASVTGCGLSLPFALSQSSESENANGGGHTSWRYGLTRADGQQYLAEVKTLLPPGLVGAIPDVTLCGEPQAGKGECTTASRIGRVSVSAGAGSSPYTFTGQVYMTGPYNGAPFGLSIVVPAVAGPFNLGPVISRATVSVNPYTAQVTADSVLPTIVKGVPIRLRSLTVDINRQGFLFNPTNCSSPKATESVLTSTLGAVQGGLASPFPLENCGALSFAPRFSAATSANASRLQGASLRTTITQGAGQANIAAVRVTLPIALPSRQSTLQKACLKATFDANPASCPAGSVVGTASVVTPTLPGTMTGKAYFVAVGGAEFPNLELVVEGSGVRVILIGNTRITKGITTTTFAATPDAPVSSVTVNLPMQTNSALASNGDLCRRPLVMPTEVTGQNGKKFKQNTIISVYGCKVKIVGHKVIGNIAYLTVQSFGAGRLTASGSGLRTVRRTLGHASSATTLRVPLSGSRHRPFRTRVRVSFTPKGRSAVRSSASVIVSFR